MIEEYISNIKEYGERSLKIACYNRVCFYRFTEVLMEHGIQVISIDYNIVFISRREYKNLLKKLK